MRDFDYKNSIDTKWDTEIIDYIAGIRELRGRQDLYLNVANCKVDRLVELAIIESTKSSNDIEGIRTTSLRLKQLMTDKITPRNRDEEEIAGYRDVLTLINENYEYINISTNYILQLHKVLFSRSSKDIGGKFKNVQNYISAIDNDGKSYTIFTPLKPYETKDAIDMICDSYNIALAKGVEPLVLIPIFIHDFLCIHPFLDGNGRMSRLLTTLLLYKSGYFIGRYISLESKIAQNKNDYYNALSLSQNGWHTASNDNLPFLKYTLGVILSAYRDAEERLSVLVSAKSSSDIVENALESIIGKFTKSDILTYCPTLSVKTIETKLKALQDSGKITKHSQGKSTFYTKNY